MTRKPAPTTHPLSKPLRPYFLKLVRARLRLGAAHAMWIFTTPLLFIFAFYGLTLTGIFGRFFTIANLIALAIFVALFMQSLGRAYQHWRPNTAVMRRYARARRDYEVARGYRYRLPDVLDDQPALDAFDQPQLAAARFLLEIENALPVFALPLSLATLFVSLAWLGVFPALYPWAHLAALVLFTCLFFEGLDYARRRWTRVPESRARRLVERASGLRHRPLDVLDDRPARAVGAQLEFAQDVLWQAHKAKARAATRYLNWPKLPQGLKLSDPYALRYGLLILLAVAGVAGWGQWGGRLLTAINPAIGHNYMAPPPLDAWITPPAYTHLTPIMVATPAGTRHGDSVIEVPAGSVFSVHLAEREGDAPVLIANNTKQKLNAVTPKGEAQDFTATVTLTAGDTITIKRGWRKLGDWHIRILPDHAPDIAFDEAPFATARQSTALSYVAHDDYGVSSVALQVTPRQSTPNPADNQPFEVPLSTPADRDVRRAAYVDLTEHLLAGSPVELRLIATDEAGHRALSQPVDFTLPERAFFNPFAHALSEERKKLLHQPMTEALRNEAANLMANIAHQPASYRGDPLVAMALRSGAVRLVLQQDAATIGSVADLQWQSAVRIEEGSSGAAAENLRAAQRDLNDALDRNASEADVQHAIDRLHQALAHYLAELSTRVAQQPALPADLTDAPGQKTNMITPEDVMRMLENMSTLSMSGSRDAARAELARLQRLMENLTTAPPQATAAQRQALAKLKALRQLANDQQALIDQTFRNAASAAALTKTQRELMARLNALLQGKPAQDGQGPQALDEGAQAMDQAASALQQSDGKTALPFQTVALTALKKAQDELARSLQQAMMGMPQPGMGRQDPSGKAGGGKAQDETGVSLQDRSNAGKLRAILNELQHRAGEYDRPQDERDYIDRLLKNF